MTKLLVDAGQAAAWYQDRVFQNLECRRLQVDEIWGFVSAKAKNAKSEKKARGESQGVRASAAFGGPSALAPPDSLHPLVVHELGGMLAHAPCSATGALIQSAS